MLPVSIIKTYAVVLNRVLKTANRSLVQMKRREVNICTCCKCFLYIEKLSKIVPDPIIYIYFVLGKNMQGQLVCKFFGVVFFNVS